MNKTVLACQDLSKRFKEGPLDVEVLKKISIQVEPGQRIAIMGASGSGKSTLLHLLGGLESPSSGQVYLDGQSIIGMNERQLSKLRNKSLGFIYQFHHLLGEFTLVENVAMPLLIRGDDVDAAESQAHALLERVGLKQRTMHKPGELSGGERQRAAIARALVTRPKCVLADEPTGNLDRKTADHVYELMLELNKEYQVSFVVVTHDAQLAAKMDLTYMLQDGAILN
jgi:lipoprotein-releasing system ATP-binding protein